MPFFARTASARCGEARVSRTTSIASASRRTRIDTAGRVRVKVPGRLDRGGVAPGRRPILGGGWCRRGANRAAPAPAAGPVRRPGWGGAGRNRPSASSTRKNDAHPRWRVSRPNITPHGANAQCHSSPGSSVTGREGTCRPDGRSTGGVRSRAMTTRGRTTGRPSPGRPCRRSHFGGAIVPSRLANRTGCTYTSGPRGRGPRAVRSRPSGSPAVDSPYPPTLGDAHGASGGVGAARRPGNLTRLRRRRLPPPAQFWGATSPPFSGGSRRHRALGSARRRGGTMAEISGTGRCRKSPFRWRRAAWLPAWPPRKPPSDARGVRHALA